MSPLEDLLTHWMAGCVNDDDVDLRQYLMAWGQLLQFMGKMGVVFQLVDMDVRAKLRTIESSIGQGTVGRMVNYEMAVDGARNKRSSSVAVIRLHRAMEFAMEVMRLVRDCGDREPMGPRVREVYGLTLGSHLPWYINAPINLAFGSFPSRKQLLHTLCGNMPEHVALPLVTEALTHGQIVYNRIHHIFTLHQLHDISQY